MDDPEALTAQIYWSKESSTRDDVLELAAREPERFYALLPTLLSAAPSEDALAIVGAGPLEVFVHTHGASFIDRLEELAERTPRLGIALGCMWATDEDEVNKRINRIILRSAAALPADPPPAGAEVIAHDLLGPATIIVDGESCYWSAAGTISDQQANVIMASRDGAAPRVVATGVPVSTLADAGNCLVATDGANVVLVDKKTGAVAPIARGEYSITSLCAVDGRAYWTAMAVIRTSPLADPKPTTLLIADSPRAKTATSVNALTTDGRYLYWTQMGHGEIVRATLAGEEREYLAVGEAQPRQLQAYGSFVYWTTGSGPMQIRRVSSSGGACETVLETDHVTAFAVDRDWVYWTDGPGQRLMRRPSSGGRSELLLSGLTNPQTLGVVDGTIYTVSARHVIRTHPSIS